MFKRGFKARCERLSEEYRREMGLQPTDPLSPWELARFLEVTVWEPEVIPDLDRDVLSRLTGRNASQWSAVTICTQGIHLIVLNSAHAKTRQANDLAHELSHLICEHEPVRADVTENGFLVLNTFDKDEEEEADWLAAALLLPRAALISVAHPSSDLEGVAREYGVSMQLLKMRMNRTGVRLQYERTSAWRRR